MKNIHVIPTDKPSRLCFRNYFFINKDDIGTYSNVKFQNIYITSDEKIKEGDWYLINDKSYSKYDGHFTLGIDCKKIILTTDQALIADGVQAIDNEFLEWFVKNPSCERVDVELTLTAFDDQNRKIEYAMEKGDYVKKTYKIIIPQEESKPHLFCETPEEKCTMNYCDENGCQNRVRHLVEPKQETLEEAAERYENSFAEGAQGTESIDFIEGAKWQAERRYSEDDVIELLHSRMRYTLGEDYKEVTTIDWFEKFKKK
jgi:hypothetical protein